MSLITTEELRKLLYNVHDHATGVCFRFRLIGELWQKNFASISLISRKGVILQDPTENEFITILDLEDVIQFEIDMRFQEFNPHFHYQVVPERVKESKP